MLKILCARSIFLCRQHILLSKICYLHGKMLLAHKIFNIINSPCVVGCNIMLLECQQQVSLSNRLVRDNEIALPATWWTLSLRPQGRKPHIFNLFAHLLNNVIALKIVRKQCLDPPSPLGPPCRDSAPLRPSRGVLGGQGGQGIVSFLF